jgi:OPT oligopeptide transporter protein
LMTCLIFYLVGWVEPQYRLVAISIAGIVCIASSNGGTTAQDLKTGYLVGATPWKQQIAIAVGAITSAVVIGGTLIALNGLSEIVTKKSEYLPKAGIVAPVDKITETQTGSDGKEYKVWRVTETGEGAEPGIYRVDPATGVAFERVDPGIGGVLEYRDDDVDKRDKIDKYTPPQPQLFATIIKGVLGGKLPWGLVLIGAGIAFVMFLGGVSPLAFAVGVYLPLSTTFPIFLGGMVRGVVDRIRKLTPEESDASPAVLMSSGLIAGASLMGILLATLEAPVSWMKTIKDALDLSQKDEPLEMWSTEIWPALATFAVLMAVLLSTGLRGPRTVADRAETESS